MKSQKTITLFIICCSIGATLCATFSISTRNKDAPFATRMRHSFGSSSYLRRITQRSYRSLTRIYIPATITTIPSSMDSDETETIVEFRTMTYALENMTMGTLNLTILPHSSMESLGLTVIASYANDISGSISRVLVVKAEDLEGSLSFDVSEFIWEVNRVAKNITENNANNILKIFFILKQKCNSIDFSICPSMLDVNSGIHFLKLDYQNNNYPSTTTPRVAEQPQEVHLLLNQLRN